MEGINKCPICFEELKEEETAAPDVCDHTFCLICLQKWAKREKVCPVDRKRFKNIIDLSTALPILIKSRKRKKQPELYDVSIRCEVCSKSNDEDTLILCDCCDLGFHCKCLTPPLSAVPSGVWQCPLCVAVSENIRSKKGITKDVELVFNDHIQANNYSSDSESSLDKCPNTPLDSNKSKCGNSTKSLKSQKRPNLERDALNDSKSLYESNSSTSNANICHSRSPNPLSTRHLSKLRPRERKPHYNLNGSSSSEEDFDTENKETYNLRNMNFKYSNYTHYTLGESSNSSEGMFGVEHKPNRRNRNQNYSKRRHEKPLYTGYDNSNSSDDNCGIEHKKNYLLRKRNFNYLNNTHSTAGENSNYSLRNRYKKYSKAMDLTLSTPEFKQSKPLDLRVEERSHNDLNFSFRTKHSIQKTFPEATVTSSEVNNAKGLTIPDIVIKQTISLTSAKEVNNKTIEETKTESTVNVSFVEKNKELLKTYTTLDKSCVGKPLSSVGDKTNKELDMSLSESKNNLPFFNNSDFNIKIDKDSSNLDPHQQNKQEMPTLSVFEKLEDDCSSEKKYFDINHGLENFTNTHKNENGPPVILPKISSVKSCNDQTNFITQETKTLSKELLEMQNKKWKTYHLQSQRKCTCNLGLQWCYKHYKNKVIDSVQIGHHNKYSQHFSKLLSTTRPFTKKPKWNQLDLVILKNVRKKTGIIYSSDNSSSSPNYNPYIHAVNDNQSKIISMEAKNILKMKEAEKALLYTVMCVSSVNDLAVRPNGTVFVDWKNHNS